MRRRLICALLLGTAWMQAGRAEEVQGGPALVPATAPARPSLIHDLQRENRAILEALEAEAARSADPEAVQRQVMEVKRNFELARLEILAGECRAQGREAEALLAEERLEALRNPAPQANTPVVVLSAEEKEALEARQPRSPRPADNSSPGIPATEEGGAR